MGRVDDPLSEASIGFFVDGNHVWGIPSPVRRGYDAAFDPVIGLTALAELMASIAQGQFEVDR